MTFDRLVFSVFIFVLGCGNFFCPPSLPSALSIPRLGELGGMLVLFPSPYRVNIQSNRQIYQNDTGISLTPRMIIHNTSSFTVFDRVHRVTGRQLAGIQLNDRASKEYRRFPTNSEYAGSAYCSFRSLRPI
uniref:Uncharacterized protein n=1 Tax=uncultured bacterium fosmid pJB45G2 TaxID=1478065 RepID=A0A0H3U7U1_9BACT|nr:hypothetical protein [uncultured bacterium fosmid pJB45G2]